MTRNTYTVAVDTAEGEALRRRLCAFLQANGIDPAKVPVDAPVTLDGRLIRYREVVGIDEEQAQVRTVERSTPMVAPMPQWPRWDPKSGRIEEGPDHD